MKRIENIKILKAIGILLFIIFVAILLFYLGIVVPEYCACDETMYEGQRGIDIWGDEVLCDGESQAFAKVFFQLVTFVVLGLSVLLGFAGFLIYRIKKNHRQNDY